MLEVWGIAKHCLLACASLLEEPTPPNLGCYGSQGLAQLITVSNGRNYAQLHLNALHIQCFTQTAGEELDGSEECRGDAQLFVMLHVS